MYLLSPDQGTDWKTVLPPNECSYILGNPPFVGQTYQSEEQKKDQAFVLADLSAKGVLDFVCNWYVLAAQYIQGSGIRCAFVSTNSITQGEQVGILWSYLFSRYQVKIHFGFRTFPWSNEAAGKAAVHVVIVGFGYQSVAKKRIFESAPYSCQETPMSISPYLVIGSETVIGNRTTPLNDVPKMSWGNKPTDGGHFIMSPDERRELLDREPQAAPLVRRYMGGGDFINDIVRYCLWLVDADPALIRKCPTVLSRIEKVREFRLQSEAKSTQAYASKPTLFRQIAQPNSAYLAIPEVSSENRDYIPMAFLDKDVICSNTLQFVPAATAYHFGILTSCMHMAWVRTVCGRLKSDYRYSNSLVYNNYPWPEPSDNQREAIETAAQNVLDARKPHLAGGASLADLYSSAMPPALITAHQALDRAVEKAYRPKPFINDRERVEFLFALYEKISSPLAPTAGAKARGRKMA
ncbi:MAG: class I SAM-dependent DNA methyltransferase [Verrucomicrobia bacterium]|nr:class I SAM-dependent DNA methyltransferase [Verrucomicrobiota bacterium]